MKNRLYVFYLNIPFILLPSPPGISSAFSFKPPGIWLPQNEWLFPKYLFLFALVVGYLSVKSFLFKIMDDFLPDVLFHFVSELSRLQMFPYSVVPVKEESVY